MILNRTIIRQLYLILMLIIFFSISTLSKTNFRTKLNTLDLGDILVGYNAELFNIDIYAVKFQFYNTRWFKRTLYSSPKLPVTNNYASNTVLINLQQSHASWSYNDQVAGRTNFDTHSVMVVDNIWFLRRIYLWLGGWVPDTVGRPPGHYQGTVILTVAY